jgi:hypothetical protein
MIHQGLMVNAPGVRLFLHGPQRPAFDQNAGVALEQGTDLGVRLGADQPWID